MPDPADWPARWTPDDLERAKVVMERSMAWPIQDHLLDALGYAALNRREALVRQTGRTTRLVCYALALAKEGGDVCVIVHRESMIDYAADLLYGAAGDFLVGAEVLRNQALSMRTAQVALIIKPKRGGEIRIQTSRAHRDVRAHVLVDHVVRGEA